MPRQQSLIPRSDPLSSTPTAGATADALRSVRPFMWLATLVLAGLYILAVVTVPEVRSLGRFLLLTALMGIHIALHWAYTRIASHRRFLLPYFTIQSLLALGINLIAGPPGLMLGLYLALLGEAVGMLRDLLWSSVAAVALLGLAALTIGLGAGWTALPAALGATALMAAFVMIYVVVFVREMDSRRRAERLLKDLEAAHLQLEAYSAQVRQLTLSQERQRMARDLHDTLAQGLAGLILQLEAVDSYLDKGDGTRAQGTVQQAMARARSTLAEARSAIGELRRVSSLNGDLREIAQAEADRFASLGGVVSQLRVPEGLVVSEWMAEQVQRFLSEGLSNVLLHAHASEVEIDTAEEEGRLSVTISDNGVGFDSDMVLGQEGHYGLVGLRERAQLAGGTVMVASRPGAGTRLELQLPLGQESPVD